MTSADEYTRFLAITELLRETRLALPPSATDEQLVVCNSRVNALLDALEAMAIVPNVPARLK